MYFCLNSFSLKKVLIIRFSSIGDIILTTPVLRCLKQQTGVEVHYLTKKSFSGLLKNNPYVEAVHSIDKEIGAELIEKLNAEQFDFIVDLHGNWRSLRIKKALGLPSKTFAKLNLQKWLLIHLGIDLMPRQHVVDRYLDTLAHLGVSNVHNGLDYFMAPETSVDVDLNKPFIAWSIGGSFTPKKLAAAQVADVCNKMDVPVYLLGGPQEVDEAEAIIEACGQQNIQSFCGKLSLDQTALLIKNSRLLLSNDTGLMHIGAAFKKSIVSFWGCTKPSLGFAPYAAASDSVEIISNISKRPCSKHGKSCKHNALGCIKSIDSDKILKVLEQQINLLN